MVEDSNEPQNPSPIPQLPPLRKFTVRRMNPVAPATVETLTLLAHKPEASPDGSMLQFVRFFLDPVTGPEMFIVRCLHSWVDFEEEVIQPSRVILFPETAH